MEKPDKNTIVYYNGDPYRVKEVNGIKITIESEGDDIPKYTLKVSVNSELLIIPKKNISQPFSYLEDRNGT